MTVLLAALLLIAAIAGAYLFSESRRWKQIAAEERNAARELRTQLDGATARALQAEAEVRLISRSQQKLEDRFRALADDVLKSNSQLFLDRSREQVQGVVAPVTETLNRFEQHVRQLETDRAGAYQGLRAQVNALVDLQNRVKQSADELKNALRSSAHRGRWGELQLRRAVELAGMLEHCDFDEQKTLFGDTNQRPDLIVNLPNGCQVVVDAKVSLEAYLRAVESADEGERARLLADHARQVRTHVKTLSEKAYWERLPCSPDFVVAFLPLESLFSAALEQDPALLEMLVNKKVILATPTTLIALLLTVAHGWREHALSESAERIRALGSELYARVVKLSEHFADLGSAIGKSVTAYNSAMGSLERNVLNSARKFRELQPSNVKEIEELGTLDDGLRQLDASKWLA